MENMAHQSQKHDVKKEESDSENNIDYKKSTEYFRRNLFPISNRLQSSRLDIGFQMIAKGHIDKDQLEKIDACCKTSERYRTFQLLQTCLEKEDDKFLPDLLNGISEINPNLANEDLAVSSGTSIILPLVEADSDNMKMFEYVTKNFDELSKKIQSHLQSLMQSLSCKGVLTPDFVSAIEHMKQGDLTKTREMMVYCFDLPPNIFIPKLKEALKEIGGITVKHIIQEIENSVNDIK